MVYFSKDLASGNFLLFIQIMGFISILYDEQNHHSNGLGHVGNHKMFESQQVLNCVVSCFFYVNTASEWITACCKDGVL